jgi:hypothetical protein
MSPWQWFQDNTLTIFGALIGIVIMLRYKSPNIQSWTGFLDSFESKGAQLLLVWLTDMIVLIVIVRYWKNFDAQLQTAIVGLLSGINGAFLGAIGARPSNGNGGAKPDTLTATFVPAQPPIQEKK